MKNEGPEVVEGEILIFELPITTGNWMAYILLAKMCWNVHVSYLKEKHVHV